MQISSSTRKAIFFFSTVMFLVSFASAALRQQTKPTPSKPTLPDIGMITGYRKWTLVNPQPHHVNGYLAYLCRRLTPEEAARQRSGPHKDKWVSVYVNNVGQDAMLHKKHPFFPVGSVIVKEKLPSPDSHLPELLTVMRKREAGYDAKNGDWEYRVFDWPGTATGSKSSVSNCQACHAGWSHNGDYVSRAYLSEKQWAGLK